MPRRPAKTEQLLSVLQLGTQSLSLFSHLSCHTFALQVEELSAAKAKKKEVRSVEFEWT